MPTLKDIAPEFSKQIQNEMMRAQNVAWFEKGPLEEKLAIAQAEVLRLQSEIEALHVTEDMAWRQRLFLNVEEALKEILKEPKIDLENHMIFASGHNFGCFCTNQDTLMKVNRRRLIEFCRATGLRVTLDGGRYNCDYFWIDDMMMYDPTPPTVSNEWFTRGYHNPDTL